MSQETPEAVGTVWQELYAAALLELERNKLLDRIKEAEQAIATCYAGLDAARDAEKLSGSQMHAGPVSFAARSKCSVNYKIRRSGRNRSRFKFRRVIIASTMACISTLCS